MPLNHTMMKIEVRQTAITRVIIAASRRPLLGSIASVYKKKEYHAALHHVKNVISVAWAHPGNGPPPFIIVYISLVISRFQQNMNYRLQIKFISANKGVEHRLYIHVVDEVWKS